MIVHALFMKNFSCHPQCWWLPSPHRPPMKVMLLPTPPSPPTPPLLLLSSTLEIHNLFIFKSSLNQLEIHNSYIFKSSLNQEILTIRSSRCKSLDNETIHSRQSGGTGDSLHTRICTITRYGGPCLCKTDNHARKSSNPNSIS